MGKDCNCKQKANANNLVKNVNDINKSSSKDHISNKNIKIDVIIKTLTIIIYTFSLLFLVVGIIPIIAYSIISKKPITLKMPFNKQKHGI